MYIIIIILLILLILSSLKKEGRIYFMDSIETGEFLFNDNDNFVKNLTQTDLYARNVKTSNEYISEISNLGLRFNYREKKKILDCVYKADLFFKNLNDILLKNNKLEYLKINGKEIKNIKWVFSLTDETRNVQYENGYPHTRENVIFLTKNVLNSENLTSILIHEKIHIYQRYNEKLFNEILNEMNYNRIHYDEIELAFFNGNLKINPALIRSNPDLNDYIYYDINNQKLMGFYYKNNTPSGINDITDSILNLEPSSLNEHPYEKIAYDIANLYEI